MTHHPLAAAMGAGPNHQTATCPTCTERMADRIDHLGRLTLHCPVCEWGATPSRQYARFRQVQAKIEKAGPVTMGPVPKARTCSDCKAVTETTNIAWRTNVCRDCRTIRERAMMQPRRRRCDDCNRRVCKRDQAVCADCAHRRQRKIQAARKMERRRAT